MYYKLGWIFSAVSLLIIILGISTNDSTVLIVGLVGLIGSLFLSDYLSNERKRELTDCINEKIKSAIANIDNFESSQQFIAADKETYIAIDEERKKICIIENTHENINSLHTDNKYVYNTKVFSYEDVLQSEVLHDDGTVTTTSRSGVVGGALLGGLIAGGIGAVIGGLSASKTTTDRVKKVQLQLVVNDMAKSFYRITFGYFPLEITKEKQEYKTVEKVVTHWHNIMSFLIKEADKNEKTIPNVSVADELTKLSDLLKQNLITTDEFTQQKARLLG